MHSLYLLLINPTNRAPGRPCFVIAALPGFLHLYFYAVPLSHNSGQYLLHLQLYIPIFGCLLNIGNDDLKQMVDKL